MEIRVLQIWFVLFDLGVFGTLSVTVISTGVQVVPKT